MSYCLFRPLINFRPYSLSRYQGWKTAIFEHFEWFNFVFCNSDTHFYAIDRCIFWIVLHFKHFDLLIGAFGRNTTVFITKIEVQWKKNLGALPLTFFSPCQEFFEKTLWAVGPGKFPFWPLLPRFSFLDCFCHFCFLPFPRLNFEISKNGKMEISEKEQKPGGPCISLLFQCQKDVHCSPVFLHNHMHILWWEDVRPQGDSRVNVSRS